MIRLGLRMDPPLAPRGSPSGGLMRVQRSLAYRVCEALRAAIYRRVAVEGRPAQGRPQLGGHRRIHKSYGVPGKLNRAGEKWYPSGAAIYRSAKSPVGSFRLTWGMWLGLKSARRGMGAELKFTGRSRGQHGTRIPNRDKAAMVLEQTGINVLNLTRKEIREVRDGIVGAVQGAVDTEFPMRIEWGHAGAARSQIGRRIRGA